VTRVALVTGATSGIGRAAALALSEAGWWTMVAGRDEERARQAAGELNGDGGYATVDLAEDDGPRRLVEQTIERGGGLDLLVNNAGVHSLATVAELADDDLDELLDVNLRAAIRLAGLAVRQMRESGGGVVINVARRGSWPCRARPPTT
jgi:NAD(P)-dependent dehydrogenase (short-subunit alcohol dehydrogenase family)